MRPLIIHYHLYKNAGTSVDAILQYNFGHQWAQFESDNGQKIPLADLENFIENNQSLKAISSHTAEIALPKIQGVQPIPIIFFRHPIDRIRSVYDFERQQSGGDATNQMANIETFRDYYFWRLGSGAPWQVTNFQCFKMKDFFEPTHVLDTHLFRSTCEKVIELLPFIGLVEDFESSMAEFAKLIREFFPDFQLVKKHENCASGRRPRLKQRLSQFRNEIGPELYKNLYQLNAMDLECFYNLVEKNKHLYEMNLEDS